VGTYLEVLAAATKQGVLDPDVHDLAVDALTHHWRDEDSRWSLLSAAS
jgi:orotate phosphoribosyltransferase